MKSPTTYWWLIALVIALGIRFANLSTYPLTDTTEARYGEIARVMATSGDWITPQLEVGSPFWAKPPLSFWQGALSINTFGDTEFAVRLPMFINLLLVLAMTFVIAKALYSTHTAIIASFIVITSTVGFVTSGAVMTDPSMVSATTLAMISFWFAVEQRRRLWGYVFFIALALGFLAKGPVAWVIIGMPILVWITLFGRWKDMWRHIPVFSGLILTVVIALPWFVLSEQKTPGFLDYFFIGEHINRFLDSGWEGDLYGNAHDEPRGTIWLFALASFAPWSFVFLALAIGGLFKNQLKVVLRGFKSSECYLVIWCLWPIIFFTFAGNILPTYVLPALPAFAILLASSITKKKRALLYISPGFLLPGIFLFAGPLGLLEKVENKTQQSLVQYAKDYYPDLPLVYIGNKKPHSARFYSKGAVLLLKDHESIQELNLSNKPMLIATRQSSSLFEYYGNAKVHKIGEWKSYTLLKLQLR